MRRSRTEEIDGSTDLAIDGFNDRRIDGSNDRRIDEIDGLRDLEFQIGDSAMKAFRFKGSAGKWMVVALFFMAFSLSAFAQTQPPPTPTPAAVDEFVPMSQAAPREVLPATPMVFYAYAFVWVSLIVYVFSIWRRMTRVEQDLAAVRRRLQDSAGGR
jgi:hypothetical protein